MEDTLRMTGANAPEEKPEKKKKKRKKLGIIEIIILLIALCVMGYSGWRLYDIYHGYYVAKSEYEGLASGFTVNDEGTDGSLIDDADDAGVGDVVITDEEEKKIVYTSAAATSMESGLVPPISVDFDGLKAINPDIIAWIYVEGATTINYPILQGSDNDYYLHRDYAGNYLYAGCIFLDYRCSKNFTDANSYIYGHRMRDRSMFGNLRYLQVQETVDQYPYIWILTPEWNYCYRIFSVFETPMESYVFETYLENNEGFGTWVEYMKASSALNIDTTVDRNDKVITLSTCTSDHVHRVIVAAKMVAMQRVS